jgi:hypothetical protein
MLKFIWGIKASDEVSTEEANFKTMNDIEILYNKKTKMYHINIETIYGFDNDDDTLYYLEGLLRKFTEYMDQQGLDKNRKPTLHCYSSFKAESIEELYVKFKMFVLGWKAVLKNE